MSSEDLNNTEIKKSLLDIVKENFLSASRNVYVNRLIYIVEHTYNNVVEFYETFINEHNKEYCAERITGLLILYKTQFCHIIEGSDESIMKFLLYMKEDETFISNTLNIKLLFYIHHINKRFMKTWTYIEAQPAILIKEIDSDTELHTTLKYLENCLDRLNKFVLFFSEYYYKKRVSRKRSVALSRDETILDEEIETNSIDTSSIVLPDLYTYYEYLPEIRLFDFFFENQYIENLFEYFDMIHKFPQDIESEDYIWPIEREYVPFNVFDKKKDYYQNTMRTN